MKVKTGSFQMGLVEPASWSPALGPGEGVKPEALSLSVTPPPPVSKVPEKLASGPDSTTCTSPTVMAGLPEESGPCSTISLKLHECMTYGKWACRVMQPDAAL